MEHLPTYAPQDPSLLSEERRRRLRNEYREACEAQVLFALDGMESIGCPRPYTAERILGFLIGAEERIQGGRPTIEDVRCGLLILRKQGALRVVPRGDEETHYELAPHVARAAGG